MRSKYLAIVTLIPLPPSRIPPTVNPLCPAVKWTIDNRIGLVSHVSRVFRSCYLGFGDSGLILLVIIFSISISVGYTFLCIDCILFILFLDSDK